MEKLSLHQWHLDRGAKMVPFAGYEMPVQYESGILAEHRAVRGKAGLFDVSHMGEITVEGVGAAKYLDQCLVNSPSKLAVGKALYSILTNKEGGVIDDLIVYRDAEEAFFLCVNASNRAEDFAHLQKMRDQQAPGLKVEDISGETGLLALQGPLAAEILSDLKGEAIAAEPPFTFVQTKVADIAVRLSRTGYTGERGFELYVDAKDLESLANALWEAGKEKGLSLCGLGCRDSLRLEAGYPLHGHEISPAITPVQARLSWVVDWDKEESYPGKEILHQQKTGGVPSRVCFFRTRQRRILREGTEIVSGGKVVGKVLSGTMSPVLNEAIGSALIEKEALPAKDWAGLLRGKEIPLERVKPPFMEL